LHVNLQPNILDKNYLFQIVDLNIISIMNRKKTIIIVTLFMLCSCLVDAQQSDKYPILAMEVQSTIVGSDTTLDGLPMSSDSIFYNAHMLVTLFDTTSIASLHVKFGQIPGNYNLLQTTYVFDVAGNLGNNTSYSRTGLDIVLGLGIFQGISVFYSELTIERIDGSVTSQVLFNR